MNGLPRKDEHRFRRRTRVVGTGEPFTKEQKRAIRRGTADIRAAARDWGNQCMAPSCYKNHTPGQPLCAECEKRYNPRCEGCGKIIKTEVSRKRLKCSDCSRNVSPRSHRSTKRNLAPQDTKAP